MRVHAHQTLLVHNRHKSQTPRAKNNPFLVRPLLPGWPRCFCQPRVPGARRNAQGLQLLAGSWGRGFQVYFSLETFDAVAASARAVAPRGRHWRH